MSEESKETKNENVNNEEEAKEKETEQVKSDTKSTFNNAKESFKNVNFKQDAKGTSGYVTGMFKDPLGTLKAIVEDKKNTNFKNAIILVFVWLVVVLLTSIFGVHWTKKVVGNNILQMIADLLAPIIGIVTYAYIVYFMQKSSKRNLTTNITAVTTAIIPTILVEILSVLNLFSNDFARVINPLSYFATTVSVVFLYFTTKDLMDEEDDTTFVKKYCSVQFIYFIVYFILTFLKIYIPHI